MVRKLRYVLSSSRVMIVLIFYIILEKEGSYILNINFILYRKNENVIFIEFIEKRACF